MPTSGQAHGDVEGLGEATPQVAGVGFDGAGVGVHEGLEDVVALALLAVGQEPGVTLVEGFADGRGVLAGQAGASRS